MVQCKGVGRELKRGTRHGSNDKGNNDTKRNMRDNKSGDFTPWCVSKKYRYCGMVLWHGAVD